MIQKYWVLILDIDSTLISIDSLKARLRFLQIKDYHLDQLGMELKFFVSFT